MNMSSKVGRLLKRHKFARFCDVLAAEEVSQILNGQAVEADAVSGGVTAR
jgi:hypothetical protein